MGLQLFSPKAPVSIIPSDRNRSSGMATIQGSAKVLDQTSKADIELVQKNHEIWQDEAWAYFDLIGEIKYGARLFSNAISQVRLFAATQPNPEEEPISVVDAIEPTEEQPEPWISEALADAATDELNRLKSSDGDEAEIMRTIGLDLWVAGEGYLVGEISEETGKEEWRVYSDAELKVGQNQKGFEIRDTPKSAQGRALKEDAVVIRIWRKHGRWSKLADSNVRGVLEECEELLILSRSIRATGKSRLSAGILFVPEELSFGSVDVTEDGGDGNVKADPFEQDLTAAMTTPISDEGSAAAVVPIVIRGQAEMGEKITRILLDRSIDPEIPDRCIYLLRRIATGVDLPAEVLLGMADVNHWTAWQVDENAYKAHFKPTTDLITNALTVGFLRPALAERTLGSGQRQFTDEEIDRVMISHDATALVTHPNRAADATTAHAALALSTAALLRELGFNESDAPTAEEVAARLAQRGAITPELELALLKIAEILPSGIIDAGVTSAPAEIEPAPAEPDTPTEGPPNDGEPPAAPDQASAITAAMAMRVVTVAAAPKNKFVGVGKQLVEIDRILRERLMAAADAAMSRSIEKAGARLRTLSKKSSTMRSVISTTENSMVASVLGPALVARLDPEGDILEDSFDGLGERFDGWTARAQKQALNIAKKTGQFSREDIEEIEAKQEADREEGWNVFKAGLLALAGSRLYNPHPSAPPQGEFDGSVLVPPSLIREAMAVAGGGSGVVKNELGMVSVDGGESPAGLIATGDLVRDAFARVGGVTNGWTWIYGDASSRQRPFPPHEDLDGVEFSTWTDDVLSVTADGEWLGVSYYRPGDHDGCQCDFAPIMVDAGDSDQGDDTDALD